MSPRPPESRFGKYVNSGKITSLSPNTIAVEQPTDKNTPIDKLNSPSLERRVDRGYPTLPFVHLNLRRNPFGELTPAERMEVAVSDVSAFVEALRNPGFAVQFLGDQGRGKTTHLLSIWRHFPDSPYLRIGEGERPPIPVGDPLLLDEVQRISRWTRSRVFRRDISLAIGSHEDHADELRKAGKKVVTVHVADLMSAPRLQRILQRRIEAVRRGEGAIPKVQRKTVEELISHFGTNIRGMEAHLYDVFQELEGVCDV